MWTAQGATEEMRQISEVVAYISQGNTGTNLLNVGGMVECFGTMLHSCALEEEMEKAMMPVSKDVHDSEALESAPTCIVEVSCFSQMTSTTIVREMWSADDYSIPFCVAGTGHGPFDESQERRGHRHHHLPSHHVHVQV